MPIQSDGPLQGRRGIEGLAKALPMRKSEALAAPTDNDSSKHEQ
jgi:hypothetical protein